LLSEEQVFVEEDILVFSLCVSNTVRGILGVAVVTRMSSDIPFPGKRIGCCPSNELLLLASRLYIVLRKMVSIVKYKMSLRTFAVICHSFLKKMHGDLQEYCHTVYHNGR
jgi:hypothetical protein